jgi:hypothetical protein
LGVVAAVFLTPPEHLIRRKHACGIKPLDMPGTLTMEDGVIRSGEMPTMHLNHHSGRTDVAADSKSPSQLRVIEFIEPRQYAEKAAMVVQKTAKFLFIG